MGTISANSRGEDGRKVAKGGTQAVPALNSACAQPLAFEASSEIGVFGFGEKFEHYQLNQGVLFAFLVTFSTA